MGPSDPLTRSLSYVTGDLPGIGGRIKERPEDFLVEEQPLYPPSGSGEHLMLCIEKRNQTTSDVIRRVAKMFRVRRGDVGYAGLKDKHAIARQHLTVLQPDEAEQRQGLTRFEYTPFRLLWAQRHHNKLRRGHLAGNRFVIYVRQVDATAVLAARAVLERLVAHGAPNYVGWQRFGYRQANHRLGRLLLLRQWPLFLAELLGHPQPGDSPPTREGRQHFERGDCAAALAVWPRQLRHDRQALDALRQGKCPEAAVRAIDAQQRDFLISALQSAIFNEVLDRRIRAGPLGMLVAGDLAWKHDSDSVFAVDEPTARLENEPGGRVERLEVSPSGPMWGAGMLKPAGAPLDAEIEALGRHGLSQADFERADHVNAPGSRRSMRIPVRDPDISSGADMHGPFVRLAFELPRGSFATVLMREVMKNEGAEQVSED